MRVLGRIRLSRESNETGTSIERQREAVEQWSAMHGHDVIGWGGAIEWSEHLADVLLSELGTDLVRGALKRLPPECNADRAGDGRAARKDPEGALHMTDDPLYFVRKFPSECCAEVSRKGELQPCDKTAFAVAAGDDDGVSRWWPVCVYHARARRMVPLADLLAAVTN